MAMASRCSLGATNESDQYFAELEQLAQGGGWPDKESLRRFREISEQLREEPALSASAVVRLAKAVDWAELLFCARGRVAGEPDLPAAEMIRDRLAEQIRLARDATRGQ